MSTVVYYIKYMGNIKRRVSSVVSVLKWVDSVGIKNDVHLPSERGGRTRRPARCDASSTLLWLSGGNGEAFFAPSLLTALRCCGIANRIMVVCLGLFPSFINRPLDGATCLPVRISIWMEVLYLYRFASVSVFPPSLPPTLSLSLTLSLFFFFLDLFTFFILNNAWMSAGDSVV